MRIDDANQRAAAVGEEQLPGIVNHFIGSDATKWHTNIPTFGRVRYSEIYHGVDLLYYGKTPSRRPTNASSGMRFATSKSRTASVDN